MNGKIPVQAQEQAAEEQNERKKSRSNQVPRRGPLEYIPKIVVINMINSTLQ